MSSVLKLPAPAFDGGRPGRTKRPRAGRSRARSRQVGPGAGRAAGRPGGKSPSRHSGTTPSAATTRPCRCRGVTAACTPARTWRWTNPSQARNTHPRLTTTATAAARCAPMPMAFPSSAASTRATTSSAPSTSTSRCTSATGHSSPTRRCCRKPTTQPYFRWRPTTCHSSARASATRRRAAGACRRGPQRVSVSRDWPGHVRAP